MLGTTPRGDGSPQVTDAGHPLYFFIGDAKPGDVSGEGGTGWDVPSPAGAKIEKPGS